MILGNLCLWLYVDEAFSGSVLHKVGIGVVLSPK